ncbi:MAG: hypothetical protein HC905_20825 [Bacteroidales bacterium]|nr:hypothetical protein [Bacteroidales bacterium]
MGPDVETLGEVKTSGQIYANQLASTISKIFSIEYNLYSKCGSPIKQIIAPENPEKIAGILSNNN